MQKRRRRNMKLTFHEEEMFNGQITSFKSGGSLYHLHESQISTNMMNAFSRSSKT